MEVTIEKNVPYPTKEDERAGRKAMYPWRKMEVGDSFVFPKKTKKTTASSMSYRAGKMNNRTFSIKVLEEGIRCWRRK